MNANPYPVNSAPWARYEAHTLEKAAETAAAHGDVCRQGPMIVDLRHAAEAYEAAARHLRTASGLRLQAFKLEGHYIDECVSGWNAGDAGTYDLAAADAREEWALRQAEIVDAPARYNTATI